MKKKKLTNKQKDYITMTTLLVGMVLVVYLVVIAFRWFIYWL